MASRSAIRAIKHRRWERTCDWEDPSYVGGELTPIPPGPHAPNGNEAKVLRRLMAQTGLTESQLREHKCYRVQLSLAQKACGAKNELQRLALRVRKTVTRELQLPREHPQVKEAFVAAWQDRGSRLLRWRVATAQEAWLALQGL
jgi:ABC-type branched-subunit amino acid transport system substrate-binding protein